MHPQAPEPDTARAFVVLGVVVLAPLGPRVRKRWNPRLSRGSARTGRDAHDRVRGIA